MTQIRTLNLITTSSLTLMKTLVDSSHTGNNSPYEHTNIQTQTHNFYYSSESSLSQSLSKGVCLSLWESPTYHQPPSTPFPHSLHVPILFHSVLMCSNSTVSTLVTTLNHPSSLFLHTFPFS